MGKRVMVLLIAVWASAASTAVAGEPSESCRQGAALCRDAFQKLEQCEQANADKPKSCRAERTETDQACKTTTSACHRDGSRRAPR